MPPGVLQGIPAHLLTQGPPQSGPQGTPNTSAAPSTPAPTQTQQPPAAPAPQPRNLFQAAAQAAQGGGNPGAAEATPTPAPRGGGATNNDAAEIAALRNNPLVGQLRLLVQQNPALLSTFLAQLGETNPHLFELISRNQQAFLEMLAEGSGVDLGALGDDDFEGGEAGPAAGQTQIAVSQAEGEALTRLQAMGFDRQQVIQAFIACDRNEELAANYLIEHGMDDFEDEPQQ